MHNQYISVRIWHSTRSLLISTSRANHCIGEKLQKCINHAKHLRTAKVLPDVLHTAVPATVHKIIRVLCMSFATLMLCMCYYNVIWEKPRRLSSKSKKLLFLLCLFSCCFSSICSLFFLNLSSSVSLPIKFVSLVLIFPGITQTFSNTTFCI